MTPIHIAGFTGTRRGMTAGQKYVLNETFLNFDIKEFHHGDCVGSDADAHDIAEALGIRIIIHPPTDPKLRAYKKGNVILETRPYKTRNLLIVDSSQILFACPKDLREELRSGTWFTIRYAKSIRRPLIIIWPTGATSQLLGYAPDASTLFGQRAD